MRLNTFRAPVSGETRKRRVGRLYAVIPIAIVTAAVVTGMLTLAAFAQNQEPTRAPRPVLSPEANRLPDKNEQMIMQEQNAQRHNYDAANAERLKQLMQATEAMETLAMALKAQVDKPDDLSQNEVKKAETIEKLARIVKERMKLTVAAN